MALEDENCCKYNLWNEIRISGPSDKKTLALKYKDANYCYFETILNLYDSRLAYVFELNVENEKYYFSEEGLSKEYDFSKGFYNFFQMPYINEADIYPTVDWMKNAVFYQIFVDRFSRGDFQKEDNYIDLDWGSKPTPTNFAGGDLKGIIQKLPYLQELGINAIYLTPFSYHRQIINMTL